MDKMVNVAIDDRFVLKIPISDQYMNWEVVFNCSLPNCPPDFQLNDIEFFYSVTLDSMEDLLPSLKQWDHRKNKALINVISELRSAYLKYQIDKLKDIDSHCIHEYNALISEGIYAADQVEVLVEDGVANFLIKLDVAIPLNLPKGDDMIVLALKWGAHTRSANLITSASIVEHITDLQVHRNFSCNESLSEFVDEVTKSIENEITTLLKRRKDKRREFIFQLLKFIGHSIISYDALEYNNCCFLLEKDNFVYILEICFPPLFPSRSPDYRLLSAYSTSENGQPLSEDIQLPWTETRNIVTSVQQLLSFVTGKNTVQNFKESIRSSFKFCE